MPERKKRIIQGLVSDGLTTAYHSYKLLNEENIELGLIYLTQANTFITAAKTLYYEYEEVLLQTYQNPKTPPILN